MPSRDTDESSVLGRIPVWSTTSARSKTIAQTYRRTGNGVGRAATAQQNARARSGSFLIPLFIGSLALPVIFYLGPLRLSVYRVVLVVLFIPCVIGWLNGAAGRIRTADILILLTTIWAMIALVVHQGAVDAVQPAGIFLVETLGSYLLARRFVRDAQGFEQMVRSLFIIIATLLPFAAFKSFTGKPVLLDAFGKIFSVLPHAPIQTRLGLHRAQVTFEHPILFGVFCSAGFGLSLYVLGYGKSSLRRFARPAIVTLALFFSVSSGPLGALMAQALIGLWERTTRRIPRRLSLTFGLIAAAWVFVDLVSNRGAVKVLISHLALSPVTGYGRIIIWEGGSAAVMQYPWFGSGGEWDHPGWTSGSMDMFWLVNAVRYGLPAALLIAFAAVLIIIKLGRLKSVDNRLLGYRTGLVVTLAGLCLAGWGVHFWNATYSLFMFLLGSGIWMLDYESRRAEKHETHRYTSGNIGQKTLQTRKQSN